jgi:lysylphosphatidylglycerol synthetase-like protein (DUF2156 family)
MPSVLDAVESYGDNPSAFLALNRDNSDFAVPGSSGAVVYRPAGRWLIQFAGPFAADTEYVELLDRFRQFAARQRRRVLAVQLQRRDADAYAAHGFTVNQLGASYALPLADFTLRGSKFMQLRNKISRARRAGLTIDEVPADAPRSERDDIDREWLRAKGRHVKPLRFLVGEHAGAQEGRRRLFIGRIDGRAVAYITYSPVYGSRPGWLHDLSRRRAQAPPGVMEAINVTAIETFRGEGAEWLHFGFTPFSSLDPAYEVSSASPLVGRIIRMLAAHGKAIYPAATQHAYKEKWGALVILPEYIAFQGRPRIGAIWRLLRVTNAV